MEGLNVTAIFDRDDPQYDDGELYGTTVTFNFFMKDALIASMFLSEPHMFSSQDYLEIIETSKVIKNLDFCNSNGDVSISRTQTNIISFNVSKCGAGGDGSILISAPIENCREAFLEVARWHARFE
jgi:hypothetical protein